MIKWLCLLILPVLSASLVQAQLISKDFNNAAVQAMVNGKLNVVLTDDSTFNKWLKEALGKVWSVTSISFINSQELDTLVKSEKNVFLFAQAREDRGAAVHLLNAEDIAKKKDCIFMLSQGGFRQTKYLFTPATSGPKIIGFFRFSPERAATTAGNFELEMLLAFMNQSLQIIIDHKIRGSVRDSVWDHIYNDAAQIKDKTLLFNKAYADGTIELDKKVLLNQKLIDDYPFDFQALTADSVKLILQNDPGNFCYLFLYYPSSYVNKADDSGDILVYDIAGKKFLYYDDNYDGPWMEKGEMKDMIYAIKE
ncbi:MAG: hypothetical protein ABIQ74_05565 [Chitinophagales bacterium]